MPTDHELDELRELEAIAQQVLATIRRYIAYYERQRRPRPRHLRGLAILPPAVLAAWAAIRDQPKYAAVASGAASGFTAAGITAGAMALATPPCRAGAAPPPRTHQPAPTTPSTPARTPAPTPSPPPSAPEATITRSPAAPPPQSSHARRTSPERSTSVRLRPRITVTATAIRPGPATTAWCDRHAPPGLLRICLRIRLR